VNYGYDKKRLLLRCVSDEVIADRLKPQWPGCEIASRVTLMWESHELANGFQYLLAEACRGTQIIVGDELPDLGDVLRCARVKLKSLAALHFGERRLESWPSRRRKSSKKASPSTGFTRPLLISS